MKRTLQLNSYSKFFLKKIFIPIQFLFLLTFIFYYLYLDKKNYVFPFYQEKIKLIEQQLYFIKNIHEYSQKNVYQILSFFKDHKNYFHDQDFKKISQIEIEIKKNLYFENENDIFNSISSKTNLKNIRDIFINNENDFYKKFSKYKKEIDILKTIKEKQKNLDKIFINLKNFIFDIEIKENHLLEEKNLLIYFSLMTLSFLFFFLYFFNIKKYILIFLNRSFFKIINNEESFFLNKKENQDWKKFQEEFYIKKNIAEFFIEEYKWPFFIINENQEIIYFNLACYQQIFINKKIKNLQGFFSLNLLNGFYFNKKKYTINHEKYSLLEVHSLNQYHFFIFFTKDHLKEIFLEKDKEHNKNLLKILKSLQDQKKINLPPYLEPEIGDILEIFQKNIAFSKTYQEKTLNIIEKNKNLLQEMNLHLQKFKSSLKSLKVTTSFEQAFEFSLKEFFKKNQELLIFLKNSFESPISLGKQIQTYFEDFKNVRKSLPESIELKKITLTLSKIDIVLKQQLNILEAKNFDQKFKQVSEYLKEMEKLIELLQSSRKKKEDLLQEIEDHIFKIAHEIHQYDKKQFIHEEVLKNTEKMTPS